MKMVSGVIGHHFFIMAEIYSKPLYVNILFIH